MIAVFKECANIKNVINQHELSLNEKTKKWN